MNKIAYFRGTPTQVQIKALDRELDRVVALFRTDTYDETVFPWVTDLPFEARKVVAELVFIPRMGVRSCPRTRISVVQPEVPRYSCMCPMGALLYRAFGFDAIFRIGGSPNADEVIERAKALGNIDWSGKRTRIAAFMYLWDTGTIPLERLPSLLGVDPSMIVKTGA